MAEYTFRVHLPHVGSFDYTFNADESIPLRETFAYLVARSVKTERPIPYEMERAGGVKEEIQWEYALAGEDEGEAVALLPHKSLEEQGVLPGSVIEVISPESVGAPVDPRSNAFFHHCRKLWEFIRENSEYLSIKRSSRRQIDIAVTGVNAIVGLDDRERPIYGEDHELRILIPAEFPHIAPKLVPLTEVFHPNIAISGADSEVCYTESHDPTGDDIFSFMLYQWVRMVQYRAYNLTGDHWHMNERATEWLKKVLDSGEDLFPVKPVVEFHWPRRNIVVI